jgi:hypothetical protein
MDPLLAYIAELVLQVHPGRELRNYDPFSSAQALII